MVRRRVDLVLLLSVSVLGAAADLAAGSAPCREAIWKLERDYVSWVEGHESAFLDQEDFVSRLESLARDCRALDGDEAPALRRKLASLRTRIGDGSGNVPPSSPGRNLSGRIGMDRADGARPVVPAAQCSEALSLREETVSWATTDYAESTSSPQTAWFVLEGLEEGWFEVHTLGSRVDTVLTIQPECGEGTFLRNDDDSGLQSRLSVEIRGNARPLVKVETSHSAGQQRLLLSVRGTGAGAISGFVREEATGDPIWDTRVEAYNSIGSYLGADWTDQNGFYSLEGLEPDAYFLRTRYSDHHLEELWDDIPCERGCSVLDGDPIQVEDSLVTGIDFHLSSGASVSGTVTEIGGGPVTRGALYLYDQTGGSVDSDALDPYGRFSIVALEAGTYFLRAILEDHLDELWDDIPCFTGCYATDGTPIDIQHEQQATGFDFQVQRMGTISGKLTDAQSGLPIRNRRIRIRSIPDVGSANVWTNLVGEWSSGGLRPGTYFVYSAINGEYRNEVYDDIPCDATCDYGQGTPIPLGPEEQISGIDMTLDPLGSISGFVTAGDTGSPIAGLQVEAWILGESRDSEYDYTSSLGRYELTGLEPATYVVVTNEGGPFVDELFDDIPCYGGPPEGCNLEAGTPIPISLSETRGDIDFRLSYGAVLTGHILDATSGQSVPYAEVHVYKSNGAIVAEGNADFYTGRFIVGGLPAERYFLRTDSASHFDELWDDLDCESGCDPLTGTPVPARIGEVVDGLDFSLELKGGLAGQVFDTSGTPVPGVRLHAWDVNGALIAVGVSDLNGLYQVDLDSGFFFLSTDAPNGFGDQVWNGFPCPSGPAIDDLCDPLSGNRITVVGADPVQTGFDFELQPTLFSDGFESGDALRWSMVWP